jgi:hypothetical protein
VGRRAREGREEEGQKGYVSVVDLIKLVNSAVGRLGGSAEDVLLIRLTVKILKKTKCLNCVFSHSEHRKLSALAAQFIRGAAGQQGRGSGGQRDSDAAANSAPNIWYYSRSALLTIIQKLGIILALYNLLFRTNKILDQACLAKIRCSPGALTFYDTRFAASASHTVFTTNLTFGQSQLRPLPRPVRHKCNNRLRHSALLCALARLYALQDDLP